MRNEEALIQEAVINYINAQYPRLLYCASAGGVRTSMKQAVKMKKQDMLRASPAPSLNIRVYCSLNRF